MVYYKTTYGAQVAPEPHNGVSVGVEGPYQFIKLVGMQFYLFMGHS